MTDGQRRRSLVAWLPATLLLIVLLLTLAACGPIGFGLGTERAFGRAEIRIDGVALGSGGDSYPRVECRRWDSTSNPSRIIDRDREAGGRSDSDWRPGGDGPKASMNLRLPPRFMGGWEVRVRFDIGSSVYEKDFEPGSLEHVRVAWKSGRVALTDIPLVRGDPYLGRTSLDRLFIKWHCEDPV